MRQSTRLFSNNNKSNSAPVQSSSSDPKVALSISVYNRTSAILILFHYDSTRIMILEWSF